MSISDNMASFALIPELPDDIVEQQILPKVAESIMVIKEDEPLVTMPLKSEHFNDILCIYKYMGVNKAWRAHFGMGEVYNALRLALFECDVYIGNVLRGAKGIILIQKWFEHFVTT